MSPDRLGATGSIAPWLTRFAQAYQAEVAAWVKGVRSNGLEGPSTWDGYLAAAAAEACLRSAEKDRPETRHQASSRHLLVRAVTAART